MHRISIHHQPLNGYYLIGVNLQKIQYDSKTKWIDTYYDEQTIFPSGFDDDIKQKMRLYKYKK